MIDSNDIILPKALDLDYSNADELYAYHLLLGQIYEENGGLVFPRKTTYALQLIDAEARYWLKGVEGHLLDGPIADIPMLIIAYDFIYRVCMRGIPTEFCNNVRISAAKKWISGDKSVGDTEMVQILWPMVDKDYVNVEDRYRDYCLSVMDTWLKELFRFGRFRNISDKEAYQRFTILIPQKLYAYFAAIEKEKGEIRRRWVSYYKVDDLSLLDTATLHAYIPFIRTITSYGYNPPDTVSDLYEQSIVELASRPDLHPFYQEALRIEIEKLCNDKILF